MRPALRLAVAALAARPWRAALGALSIALLVLPTTLLAALAGSIEQRIVAAADPRSLLVLAAGSAGEAASVVPLAAVRRLREEPGVGRARDGMPLVSPELVVEGIVRTATGAEQITVVRGLERPGASGVHERVVLREGRWPRRGALELTLGAALQERLGGAGPDESLALGSAEWRVVGVFDAPGTSYGEEAWTELTALAGDAGRAGAVSLVRVRAESAEALGALASRIAERDAGARLEAVPEVDFQRRRAHVIGVLHAAALLIGLLAGSAAAAGLANVFYASVESRRREIGVLRALGFARRWVVGAIQLEALLVATAGLAVAVLAALAAEHWLAGAAHRSPDAPVAGLLRALSAGVSTGDGGGVFLELRARALAPGVLLAIAIGVLAASGPAWRAARIGPAEVLRRG